MSVASNPWSSIEYEWGAPVGTGAVNDDELANLTKEQRLWKDEWNQLIDKVLLEWCRNPQELEDDDRDAPSEQILKMAMKFSMYVRDNGGPPAKRIVPTSDGGISFETWYREYSQSLEFAPDGIWFTFFRGTALIEHRRLD